MKFAFIADPHLSRYGQDKIEDETNLPERLHSIKNALYEVGDYCHQNDIDTMIIGGDIYHNKSIIYAIAQDLMLDFFEQYKDLEFWVLDGNHDLSGKGANVVSALRPIVKCSNVEWITQTPVGNDNFVCIPYSHDVVNQVKNNKRKILISHFGLSEGVLNSGMSIVSDIGIKDLAGKYELVLLGHYHKPQEIIRDDISIYYVGSLIQLDWGEKGEEKRFLVVDTDTLHVDSIPISKYRKHIEIEIDRNNIDEALKAAQQAKDDGHHVKVLMKEKIDLTGIKDDFHIVDKTESDITDRGISSSMTQEDRIHRYIEIKEIPETYRDVYAKEAFDIIKNCEV
jgi:DNA repair exonuclease SbcCD nuclease subunit